MEDATTEEVTELLQALIRNACVNDGTPESGQEVRSAELLTSYLEGPGLELQTFEPTPGRMSLMARLGDETPGAPTLVYLGHTDVVPAEGDRWRRDPFGAELVDGEVWGRGAVDMLNLTASMAVATRHLARSRTPLRGNLIYVAVADEEALGTHGAAWLADNVADLTAADYVVTESGGIPLPTGSGTRLPVMVGEKGACWRTLRVHGTPGHGSQPLRTDNALVKAAEVVRRIDTYRPEADLHETWRTTVQGLGLPVELAEALLDPDRIEETCERLPAVGLARQAHACTHTTFAPTVARAGTKTNVIPDLVELELDIRTLPGQGSGDVDAMLGDILGDLAHEVEVVPISDDPASASPIDTPLWDSLTRLCGRFHEDSKLVPMLTVGATDARFFRRRGITAYGFGMFSRAITFEQFATMFHGDDERVDVESLRLSTELWKALAGDLLR